MSIIIDKDPPPEEKEVTQVFSGTVLDNNVLSWWGMPVNRRSHLISVVLFLVMQLFVVLFFDWRNNSIKDELSARETIDVRALRDENRIATRSILDNQAKHATTEDALLNKLYGSMTTIERELTGQKP